MTKKEYIVIVKVIDDDWIELKKFKSYGRAWAWIQKHSKKILKFKSWHIVLN